MLEGNSRSTTLRRKAGQLEKLRRVDLGTRSSRAGAFTVVGGCCERKKIRMSCRLLLLDTFLPAQRQSCSP